MVVRQNPGSTEVVHTGKVVWHSPLDEREWDGYFHFASLCPVKKLVIPECFFGIFA
jgi:hypothetical protein